MPRRYAHDLIFKIEHQFTLFLQRAGVTAGQLPGDQYREMRRAFYGGIGQMFFLFSQDIPDLQSDKLMTTVLKSIQDQIGAFWDEEVKLHDAGMTHLHPTTLAKCECGHQCQVQELKHPEKGTSGKLRCPICDSETIYFKASKHD
jgi:hypothetical protein